MKQKRKSYKKPTIRSKKIKANFFFTQHSRLFDSFDDLLAPDVFAQSGCGGGSCSTSCFLSGTKILMADGSQKSIEDIKAGDLIVSFNTKTKKNVLNAVKQPLVHQPNGNGYLIINGNIHTTANHPFWANGSEWKRADALKKGDKLMDYAGRKISIKSIKIVNEPETVYNLHIEGPEHNYFAENTLVHNKQVID